MSLHDDYNATVTRIDELTTKAAGARLDAKENQELLTKLEEAEGIKAQIGLASKARSFVTAARAGTGAPPLVGDPAQGGRAAVRGFTPDGQTDVEFTHDRTRDGRSVRSLLVNDHGEILMDPAKYAVISRQDYEGAFKSYLRGGERNCKDTELRTLQEGSDPSGGFLVPEEQLTKIVQRLPTPTRIAGRVTRLTTMRDSLVMPKLNYTTDNIYTTGIRVTWTGELPASATQARVTDPVFGQVRVPIFTAMMSLPLTNDMIEDSAFPIMDFVSGKFQETIDILYDDKIINGTGLGQPAGILANPGGSNQPSIINSGSAATLTGDGLLNLVTSLPEQYDANAVAVFNKVSGMQTIAELKDGQGRYLWGAGLQDSGLAPGWRDRKLMGQDTILSGLMPNVGANTYPVIFGDLTGYYLVQRLTFSMQVLRELYAETNIVLLLGRIRLGGMVAEDWKLKIQKCSV